MAVGFTQWTVLPHKPLEKHADNFWTVSGKLKTTTRVMCLAKLSDARVVVHNAIALEEPAMREIEAWGKPSFLIVPGGFHRQDAFIFKQRYPDIKVLCPTGAKKNVEKAVPVEGYFDALPPDPKVQLIEMESMKRMEGYMRVVSDNGTSLVVNDAIANIPSGNLFTRLMMGPIGQPSVPRVMRLLEIGRAHV